MSLIRARQPAITRLFPHNANRRYIVPGRLRPVIFVTQIGAIPSGNVGVPVSYDIAPHLNVTAGVVLTLASGALPAGISIVGLTLAGTPSLDGPHAFNITATNSAGSDTSAATWTINL